MIAHAIIKGFIYGEIFRLMRGQPVWMVVVGGAIAILVVAYVARRRKY